MRWLFIMLVGLSAHAQNLNRHDYTVVLKASGFQPEQRGSEYFYEVEIISNYGTLQVAKQVSAQLSRALEMQEEIGSGKLYGAPLLQWFHNENGFDPQALKAFTDELETKIAGLKMLKGLCEQLHSQALYRAASDRIKAGENGNPRNFDHIEIPLGDLLSTFRITELVRAVEKVTSLPELDQIGTPAPTKENALDKIKVPSPQLLWTVRLMQKDRGSQAKVLQETTAAADIRPNLDSVEERPQYALISSRGGLNVRATIKREKEPGRSCRNSGYRPVVGL